MERSVFNTILGYDCPISAFPGVQRGRNHGGRFRAMRLDVIPQDQNYQKIQEEEEIGLKTKQASFILAQQNKINSTHSIILDPINHFSVVRKANQNK